MPEPAILEIRALGGLTILRDGKVVRMRTRRDAALLVFLASQTERRHERAELAARLWSRSPEYKARHSLINYLYLINSLLKKILVTSNEHVWANRDRLVVDVTEFRRAAARGDASRAMRLYTGPFLDGIYVANAPRFTEWQESMRDQCHTTMLSLAERLLRDKEMTGEWEDVEALCELLLTHDPERIDISALRSFAVAALKNDQTILLTGPRERSGDTKEQFAESESLEKKTGPSGSRKFVGRGAEFAALRRIWDEVEAGSGGIAVVIGEAGIGKTTFCERFLKLVALRGGRVGSSSCRETEQWLAFGSIAEALGNLVTPADLDETDPIWAATITQILPELRAHLRSHELPHLGTQGSQRRLFEAITQLLKSMAGQRPLAILFDNFQWIDESTASLVYYITRRLVDTPILILLAVRHDFHPSGCPRGAVLRSVPTSARVNLGELSYAETVQLMTQFAESAGSSLPEDAKETVYKRVGGRPFLVLELLKELAPSKNRRSRISRLKDQSDVVLPSSIETFLTPRIRALPPEHLQVVSVLAVLGSAATPEMLRRSTDLSESQLYYTIDNLTQRGLLKETELEVDFVHDLLRIAVYRSLSWTRRRSLHRTVANVLAQEASTSPHIIAMHLERCGDAERLYTFAIEAASRCGQVHAHSEAQQLLRIALSVCPSRVERIGLLDRLANLLIDLRRFREADELLQELENTLDPEGGQYLQAQVQRLRAWAYTNAMPYSSLLDRAAVLAGRAREYDDPHLLAMSLHLVGYLAHFGGFRERVQAVIPDLHEAAERAGRTRLGVQALRLAAQLRSAHVSSAQGVEYSRVAYERTQHWGEPEMQLSALIAYADALYRNGQLEGALRCYREAEGLVQQTGAIGFRPTLLNNSSVVLKDLGLYSDAKAVLDERLRMQLDSPLDDVFAWINSAILAIEMQEFSDARAWCERLFHSEAHMPWWSCVAAHGLMGLCAIQGGQIAEAYRHRRELLRYFESRNYWMGDFSYSESFLARLGVLEGNLNAAIERLTEASQAYRDRDACCHLRLEIELARILADNYPERAQFVARDAHEHAKRIGAQPLIEKASAVLRRITLNH